MQGRQLPTSSSCAAFTKGEREHFGALVLGIYDRGKLKWAGNVGTGFDRKKMEAIHAKLAPLATEKCPLEPDKDLPKKGVTWTRPELVCEVRFSNWTEDGRLRAPVLSACAPTSIRRNAFATPAEPPSATPLLDPSKSEEIADHRRPSPEVHQSQQAVLPEGRISPSAIC